MTAAAGPVIRQPWALPVLLTAHALERACTRMLTPQPELVDQCVADVYEALRARRVAKTLPRGFALSERRGKAQRGRRLVWTADASRAYVIKKEKTAEGPVWIVLTVLVRAGDRP